jgi:hypothetical protein
VPLAKTLPRIICVIALFVLHATDEQSGNPTTQKSAQSADKNSLDENRVRGGAFVVFCFPTFADAEGARDYRLSASEQSADVLLHD